MKRISFEAFCNEWRKKLDTIWPEEEQFCIYISNPFCRKKCRFCLYKSSILSEDKYQRYYGEYLPTLIHRLAPILSMRIPDTVYFGGGTASLMDVDTMHLVFSALPNLASAKYKCFEANPASLTKEKIDALTKYGFSEISLGVQTFDSKTLLSQNRELVSIQCISELVSYASSQDIFVNIDLLTYYESDDSENITLLAKDLFLVAKQINPGKLTIYPRYETYYNADRQHRIKQIRNLRKCIRTFCDQSQYYITPELVQIDDEEAVLSYGIMDYHVYNTNSKVCAPHNRYNCSGPGFFQKPQNVIGIGGYGEQVPYSYLWNNKQWYMVNYNWRPILIEAPFNDTSPLDLKSGNIMLASE